jgi:carbamoyl-phosphate synthase large subunit
MTVASARLQPSLKPKPPWNILVFPGATEIANEIFLALRGNKDIRLFSAGAAVSNHAPFLFRHHTVVPMVGEPGWVEALKDVIARHGIDAIFPAHDDALLALAERQAELPAVVLAPALETCRATRSKSRTYAQLQGRLATPRVFSPEEAAAHLPLFAKPDVGQGSQGARRVDTLADLRAVLEAGKPYVLCELLPGKEYTVDCFSDRQGRMLYARARERIRTRSGISMATRFVELAGVREMAQAIQEQFAMQGAWFFQVKEDAEGRPVLMEVAPRIAGAMALSRASGVNLALMTVYDRAGRVVSPPTTRIDVELDRALVNRYRTTLTYSTVYVDLDDTLLVHGKLNLTLVRFLAQCLNQGVKLVVITRCAMDPDKLLRERRMHEWFNEVIWLRDKEPKSASVRDSQAIFIDDSFSEREEVAKNAGIPTFDPSTIEALLDDRE